jgi:uncharacterized protein (DUF2141 family)
MAQCSICDHPQRHLIEQALHAGTAQQTVADRFGLGSRKPLRTHLQHFAPSAPASAPVAPHAGPQRTAEGPLTTAQAQEALTRLQERHQAALTALTEAQATLAQAQQQYRAAVWRETGVHAAGQARDAAQQAVEAAQEQVTLVAEGIQAAQDALEAARARRQAAETAHWTTVLEQLDDPFEQYCCQLLRFPNRWPPPTTPAAFVQRLGPMGVSAVRKTTLAQLRERYPFVEEGATHAVSGVL